MNRSSPRWRNGTLIAIRLASTLFGFLTLRFLSRRMPASDYDAFVIIKQITGWFIAIGFLGMATALPRAIVAHRSRIESKKILLCAFLLIIPGVLFPMLGISSAPEAFSYFIFRSPEWAGMIRPFVVLTCGIAALSLLNLYLRGISRFRASMFLEMAGFSLLPFLLVFCFRPPVSVVRYLSANSLVLGVLVAVCSAAIFSTGGIGAGWRPSNLTRIFKELLSFGIPKLLSGAYQMFLVGAMPVALRWAGADLRTTAAATLGMALGVTVSAIAVTPASVVAFNEIVVAHVEDKTSLHSKVSQLLELGIVGGTAICLFGGLGTHLIVHYLIGPVYDGYEVFIDAGAAVGFLFFAVSVAEIPLDGIRPPWRKAKLSLVMLGITSLAVFLLIHWKLASPLGIIAAVGVSVLGFALVLFRLLFEVVPGKSRLGKGIWYSLAATVALATAYFFLKQEIRSPEWELALFFVTGGGVFLLLHRTGILSALLSHKPMAPNGVPTHV